MRDSTRPLPPRLLRADLLIMASPWRCMVTGEADHPLAFALTSRVHPAVPPILLSAAVVERTMADGLRDIADGLSRRRPGPG